MNKKDKWQTGIVIVQTLVIAVAAYLAWNVGVQQVAINKKLIDIAFEPSILVIRSGDKLVVHNYGKGNITIFGTQIQENEVKWDGPAIVVPTPIQNQTQGRKKPAKLLDFSNLKLDILGQMAVNESFTLPINIFLKNALDKEFVVNLGLTFRKEGGEEKDIFVQTIILSEINWTDKYLQFKDK